MGDGLEEASGAAGGVGGSSGFSVGFSGARFVSMEIGVGAGTERSGCGVSGGCGVAGAPFGGAHSGFGSPSVMRVLALIQAFVGDTNQIFGVVGILGIVGDAVIHADGDAELQRFHIFRKYSFDAAAERERLGRIGLRQEKSKFVTADAKREVRSAQSFFESGGRDAQHFIAARMSMLVVYFLEAVHVHDDQAERKAIAFGAI